MPVIALESDRVDAFSSVPWPIIPDSVYVAQRNDTLTMITYKLTTTDVQQILLIICFNLELTCVRTGVYLQVLQA